MGDKGGAGKDDSGTDANTEWVDEPSPTGNSFGQWWSTHNPLASRGESKEPKAPNASPEDSDADRREEERFRDIIERWWANLIRTSSPALENLQGNFAVALNSARQASSEAAESARHLGEEAALRARHMGEEAAIVAKRQADKAAGVAAIRAFRNDAAAWPGRFCEKQALVETTVKVATWNLWWRHGPWEQRMLAIKHVLRESGADVICLQEVWAEKDGREQAKELADALGFHCAYDADQVRDGGVRLGNAVLSRWPVLSTSTKSLSAPSKGQGDNEKRVCVRADIDGPNGLLQVYSVHLNWSFHQSTVRATQLAEVCKFVQSTRKESSPCPPILCGDLNATPDSDEIRALLGKAPPHADGMVFLDAWELAGAGPGHTWDNANAWAARELMPSRRIDYVLVGWPTGAGGRGHVTGAQLFGRDVVVTGDPSGDGGVASKFKGCVPSDHYGVLATVRY